jgi:hypothetical protein
MNVIAVKGEKRGSEGKIKVRGKGGMRAASGKTFKGQLQLYN